MAVGTRPSLAVLRRRHDLVPDAEDRYSIEFDAPRSARLRHVSTPIFTKTAIAYFDERVVRGLTSLQLTDPVYDETIACFLEPSTGGVMHTLIEHSTTDERSPLLSALLPFVKDVTYDHRYDLENLVRAGFPSGPTVADEADIRV